MSLTCKRLLLIGLLVMTAGPAEARGGRWRKARANVGQALRQACSISQNKTLSPWKRTGLALRAACRSVGLRRKAAPAVLLYQGAFDPVHKGHLTNIKSSVNGVQGVGQVFVVPTSDHPGKKPVPFKHRVAMMRKALASAALPASVHATVVNDRRLAQLSLKGFDDLTSMIHTRYPGSPVYIMTGSDAYLKAAASGLVNKALRWGYRYAVTPRAGYPLPDKLPTGVEVMPLAGGKVSSSKIRRDLGAGVLPVKALGRPVARHIADNGLYGYWAHKELRCAQ